MVRWTGLQTIQSAPEGYNRRRASAPLLHHQNAFLRSLAFLFLLGSHPGHSPTDGADGNAQNRRALGLTFPTGQQFPQPRTSFAVRLPRPPTLLPPGPKRALLYAFAVRGLPRPEKQPRYPAAFAIYPGNCYATTNFLEEGFGRTRDCSWQFMQGAVLI